MSLILTLHHHRYRLRGLTPDLLPDNTLLFLSDEADTQTEDNEAEFTFDFHFVEHLLPEKPEDLKSLDNPESLENGLPHQVAAWGAPIFARHNICIWQKDGLQRRQISTNSPFDAYAIYEETSPTHADIWFLKSLKEELRIDTVFISTLSLERHLAPHGLYIFHCAYMLHEGRAILLSGPSGAGKSTHAELWRRHVEDTRVINGDRGLICREADGTFVVNGWPVCGSSSICHNEQHPLGAIVFIEQTPGNKILPEGLAQHYRRVFAQLTINHWDVAATNAAADWIMSLCTAVPIVTYGCNMAPDAPYPLLQHLKDVFRT
ncbi:MAG: hypothetical protein J5637_04655 [Prevotella sp.]|nr:hypothetical protein [Prevotella sp.]